MSTDARIRGRAGVRIRQRHRRENPLCVKCLERGIFRAVAEVDHIVPLWLDGADDDDNRQSLCKPCHEAKTRAEMGYQSVGADGWPLHPVSDRRRPLSPQAEARRFPQDLQRSRIPLTIVCGPPGSGKSTYVHEHAGNRDVVIDLDAILSRLSGLPMHAVMTRWLGAGLEERNRRLRALVTDTIHEHAWFIIAAPKAEERMRWAHMLGAELVLLDVPADECKRRIVGDSSRKGQHDRMNNAVDAWWAAQSDRGGGSEKKSPRSDTGAQTFSHM